MLLQVFLQSGQQPGLQSARGQSSLLLQQWLQCDQLCLPPARTQLSTAVSASVVPLVVQVDTIFIIPATIHLQYKSAHFDTACCPNYCFSTGLWFTFKQKCRHQGVTAHRTGRAAWCDCVDRMIFKQMRFNGFDWSQLIWRTLKSWSNMQRAYPEGEMLL